MGLDELACKTACTEILVSLCNCLDKGDNAAAADLFAADAVVVTPAGDLIEGPKVRAFLANRSSAIATRHIMSNVLIEQTGPATATAHAYIVVYRVPKASPDVLPRALPATPQAIGDWDVQFKQTPQGWRINRYSATANMEPAQ